MSEIEALNRAMRDTARLTRRSQRAARTRAKALSPVRLLSLLLSLPVVFVVIALGTYLRTTSYELPEAALHLVALGGCDAAHTLAIGPFYRGQPGYHARLDADDDGIACEPYPRRKVVVLPQAAPAEGSRMVGGAKFVRP